MTVLDELSGHPRQAYTRRHLIDRVWQLDWVGDEGLAPALRQLVEGAARDLPAGLRLPPEGRSSGRRWTSRVGGSLRIDSREGRGTTVHLVLPLATPAVDDLA